MSCRARKSVAWAAGRVRNADVQKFGCSSTQGWARVEGGLQGDTIERERSMLQGDTIRYDRSPELKDGRKWVNANIDRLQGRRDLTRPNQNALHPQNTLNL